MATIRKRSIPYVGPTSGLLEGRLYDPWNHKETYDPTRVDSAFAFRHLNGTQVTESESHPSWINRRSRRPPTWDSGGPFTSVKQYVELLNSSPQELARVIVTDRGLPWQTIRTAKYVGPYMPISPDRIIFPPPAASSEEALSHRGTTAIARCSPSNPTADLAVAVGELFKEGVPHLIGGTLRKLRELSGQERRRAIGNEYLNYEFGWKPLVNDLTKFSRAILHADSLIKQYERDSGRPVRRSYGFPNSKSSSFTTIANDVSPWINPSTSALFDDESFNPLNSGKVIVTDEVSIDQWFSGAFMYYVPPPDGIRNGIARHVIQARKLLGLSLTPDTLWNLAPWSWAVDWFFNVGDVLSNWTDWAIDNQVLLYGYIMEHTVHKYTYTFVGPTGLKPYYTRPPNVTTVVETKVRRQATPYGFGLSWDGFSNRQLSIVAALGISRSK